MKLAKKIISVIVVLCFLGTELLHAQGGGLFNLAAPTRLNSTQFQHVTAIEVSMRRHFQELQKAELDPLDLDHLQSLGPREITHKSIFRDAVSGGIDYKNARIVTFEGARGHARYVNLVVDADYEGSQYTCMITRGIGKRKYEISVIPEGIYQDAERRGVILHDALDEKDRAIKDKYIYHEISTEKNLAIDEFIESNKVIGNYAVCDEQIPSDAADFYRHENRKSFCLHELNYMTEHVRDFFKAVGAENGSWLVDRILLKPLVFIPYDNDSELPEMKIGDKVVSVTAHSSEFATYIFLKKDLYDKVTKKDAVWPITTVLHIMGEFMHEIGANCGLDVSLAEMEEGRRTESALDVIFNRYTEERLPGVFNLTEDETRVINNLKPINLLELQLRNDYTSGREPDKKRIFASLVAVLLAGMGVAAPAPAVGTAPESPITKTVTKTTAETVTHQAPDIDVLLNKHDILVDATIESLVNRQQLMDDIQEELGAFCDAMELARTRRDSQESPKERTEKVKLEREQTGHKILLGAIMIMAFLQFINYFRSKKRTEEDRADRGPRALGMIPFIIFAMTVAGAAFADGFGFLAPAATNIISIAGIASACVVLGLVIMGHEFGFWRRVAKVLIIKKWDEGLTKIFETRVSVIASLIDKMLKREVRALIIKKLARPREQKKVITEVNINEAISMLRHYGDFRARYLSGDDLQRIYRKMQIEARIEDIKELIKPVPLIQILPHETHAERKASHGGKNIMGLIIITFITPFLMGAAGDWQFYAVGAFIVLCAAIGAVVGRAKNARGVDEARKNFMVLVNEMLDARLRNLYGILNREKATQIDPKITEIGFDGKNNRLGWTIENFLWLYAHPEAVEAVKRDAEAIKSKFKYVILSGMGGSGLSVQVVKTTFGEKEVFIYSLRTTDPAAIRNILNEIAKREGSLEEALKKTLIIPISKSGTTRETVSHKVFFERQVYAKIFFPDIPDGILKRVFPDNIKMELTDEDKAIRVEILNREIAPGDKFRDHFWVITDTGSPLDIQLYEQRNIQLNNKEDIGGRFTAPTTNIFLLPLALIAPERIDTILGRAYEMNSEAPENDVFLKLAAYLYTLAREGKDKVTVIMPAELRDLPIWAEQLFEESLGKDGKGITLFYGENITDEALRSINDNDRVFVRISTDKESPREFLWNKLQKSGYPTFEIKVRDIDSIGGLMLGFQRVVASIAYLWGICFVNQPAVEEYKKQTNAIMDKLEPGEKVKVPYETRSEFRSLKIYYQPLIEAGVLSEEEISSNVSELGASMDNGAAVYAAILMLLKEKPGFEAAELAPWGEMSEDFQDMMQEARTNIFTNLLKIPSKLAIRPDGNHSFHQNIEGGKNMFLSTFMLPLAMRQPEGMEYEPELLKAQAIGTVNALVKAQRKIVLLASDGDLDGMQEDLGLFFTSVARWCKWLPVKGQKASDKGRLKGISHRGVVPFILLSLLAPLLMGAAGDWQFYAIGAGLLLSVAIGAGIGLVIISPLALLAKLMSMRNQSLDAFIKAGSTRLRYKASKAPAEKLPEEMKVPEGDLGAQKESGARPINIFRGRGRFFLSALLASMAPFLMGAKGNTVFYISFGLGLLALAGIVVLTLIYPRVFYARTMKKEFAKAAKKIPTAQWSNVREKPKKEEAPEEKPSPKSRKTEGLAAISSHIQFTNIAAVRTKPETTVDKVAEILWLAGQTGENGGITRNEAFSRIKDILPELENDLLNALLDEASSILTYLGLSGIETYKRPSDEEIKIIIRDEIRNYGKPEDKSLPDRQIEVYMPSGIFENNSSKEYRRGLEKQFGGRIRPYESREHAMQMIEASGNEDMAIVMTVGLTEDGAREFAFGDKVRFMNFEDEETAKMPLEAFDNYMAATLCTLLLGRIITQKHIEENSCVYRMFMHLLEGRMPVDKISGYIVSLAMKYCVPNIILKAIPITAYKITKPAVQLLWSA